MAIHYSSTKMLGEKCLEAGAPSIKKRVARMERHVSGPAITGGVLHRGR